MAPQAVYIPRGYVAVEEHETTLEDLKRLQGFCNQCLLRENCRDAYAVDGAIRGQKAPSFTARIALVRKGDSPNAEPHFICAEYNNAVLAHR